MTTLTTTTRKQPSPATRRRPSPKPHAEEAIREYKAILTTGQVARICTVAPRTVAAWFDSGKLKGYRIPGSQDRRVPRENLARFLLDNGMPCPRWLDRPRVLLVVSSEALPWLEDGASDNGAFDDWEVCRTPSLFAAGMAVREADALLLDLAVGRSCCLTAARAIRSSAGLGKVKLLAMPADDEQEPDVLAALFDHVISPGCDLGAILDTHH